MAEYLNTKAKNLGIQSGFALCLSMIGSCALAENLQDPTRPSASFGAVQETNAAAVSAAGPVLQSVIISSGRMMATISGQTVRLGEKFGNAQLVKISESEVVLRNGKELQTLKLFPDVEMKRNSGNATAKADASAATRVSK